MKPDYSSRQKEILNELVKSGLQGLVLNPGPSLVYFTGLHFHLSERPVIGLISPTQPFTLVIPELEGAKTKKLTYPIKVYTYPEQPDRWSTVFRQAFAKVLTRPGKYGVEPGRIRFLELKMLEETAPGISLVTGEQAIASLRMKKDAQEIAAMRRAAEIAQIALEKTLLYIRAGVTERQIAAELTLQLLRAGSEPTFPFSPIVSSGPNSANPHANPSERSLQEGDLLVIDWGATVDNYTSDITRTFVIGEADPELSQIAHCVLESNLAGRNAVQPGTSAGEIDHAARQVIERAGYGEFFIHRTGHGLGLEAHEPPYIRADNEGLLTEGMTFTIEPGIYLPDRAGVRIEDDVVVIQDGGESLTTMPRELRRLPEA